MVLKVVYLDDEPDICEIFKANFESSEVSIKTFVDPLAAVRSIEADRPDLIFLDYRLPDTSGDRVAMRLEGSIPKALITGDLSVRPESDFVRIFYKPFRFSEIEKFIGEYASNHAGERKRSPPMPLGCIRPLDS